MAMIFTLGYEGADIDAFVKALAAARIDTVVDVRAQPFSRKADFTKKRLAGHLAGADIAYRHLPALGNPKAAREAAKAGDIATYRRIYETQLASQGAEADLARLAEQAQDERLCLVCLEADARGCHRSLITERLAAAYDLAVEHLRLDGQGQLDL
ncbi:MAG: DUF488 domain-containing protein [Alphaproteobacteria bacterium]|jgi:uncharacterized protein (DUF488 family)|nr:DUF488 domain-containing protein [Alphaproteobacteria bacterium]